MSSRTGVSGGRLLTCEDDGVLDDGALVIEDELIVWVGRTADLPTSYADVAMIDARGATIMPGLVDAHMHISFGEPLTEEELSIYTPAPYRAIRAAADAERVLLAGVTSACDPGGPYGIAVAVRDAVDAGLVQGPRFSAAGRQITTQQGIGDTLPRWIGPLESSFGLLVRSEDDIRQEIRDEVKDGVDLIKIAASGPGTEEFCAFSARELEVAVEEAHRLGRPITVHARSRQAVEMAVEAGFDWIMHASFMDDRTLDKLLERHIPLVPALTLLVNSLEAGQGVLGSAALDGIRRELEAAVKILAKARAAGAVIIAGSESGFGMTPYGYWHAKEMDLFVAYLGMSNHEALLSMTRDSAAAVPRARGRVGTLTPGKLGDVLVVDGAPDLDVRVLQDPERIRIILKGGAPVSPWRPRDLPRRRMPFESAHRYVPALHMPAGEDVRDV